MGCRRSFAHDARASGAVEFALIAPLFLLLLFAIVTFSTVISMLNGVQQITAEAARASIAGNTTSERDQLVRAFVASSLPSYPYLDATKLTVATASLQNPASFKVSLTYDMSGNFSFHLGNLVPLPPPTVTRSSIVLIGNS